MTVLEWFSKPQVAATQTEAELDSGILIFCGIGLLLSITAMLFGWFSPLGVVDF